MSIPDHFVDDLKERIVLSDLVGRRTRLKKQGKGWCGLSPFTSEKTPSFFVYDDRQFYKCYSSGKSGDAIEFLRETENLSFVEAVGKLASMAGMSLPDGATARSHRDHSELYDILAQAAQWFGDMLVSSSGQEARSYLQRRGIGPGGIRRHGLGYAPTGWRSMIDRFGKHRLDVLVASGLAVRPDSGGEPYDRFRNRVIFPIHDAAGRVIAFGGRALDSSDSVKYINSPETVLFRKSRMLFRYAQARTACASGSVMPVLVEGYMDAIALADAGIESAMAPLGTALSSHQLSLLWRTGSEPVVCFDGDSAGQRASRAMALMAIEHVRPGYSLFFASMPAGSDPDDMVRREGVEAMRVRLRSAMPLAEVIWRSHYDSNRVDTPERRAALQKTLEDLTGRIVDPTVRAAYKREFRNRLFELDRGRFARVRRQRVSEVTGPYRCSGLALLARVIDTPELLEGVVERLAEAEFVNSHTASLRDMLLSLHEAGRPTDRVAVDAALGKAGLSQARALLAAIPDRPLSDSQEVRRWSSAIGEYCVSSGLDREAVRTRSDFVSAMSADEQHQHWRHRSDLMRQKRRSRVRANDPDDLS